MMTAKRDPAEARRHAQLCRDAAGYLDGTIHHYGTLKDSRGTSGRSPSGSTRRRRGWSGPGRQPTPYSARSLANE